MNEFGHGEDGKIVPIREFDFDQVDRDLGLAELDRKLRRFSDEDIQRASEVLRVVLEWVWQKGMKNPKGLTIRSAIVCWIFIKHLKPLTLTQLSAGFGKHKQSFGRWVDHWKRTFPEIKTPHMRDKK